MFVDRSFVQLVFESYENGKGFHNINQDIERGEGIDFVSVCQILSLKNFNRKEVLVSKKKVVHIDFGKPLMLYSFFDEIISFIEQYWMRRKLFSPAIVLSMLV